MIIVGVIAKIFIRIFSAIVRRSKDSLHYLFEVALKNEVIEYYDNKYFIGYRHIEKAIAVVKKLNLPGSFIIDIGGANGRTATFFSKAFPGSTVYVFEPIKESFDKIKQKITDYPNITAINKALGNFTGTSTINLAHRISSSSMMKLNADKNSVVFRDILKPEGIEKIEVETLDNAFHSNDPVSIIKIDVQGYELEVLKGGLNTLKRTSLLILEVSNHGGYVNAPGYYMIDEFLRNNFFVLYDIFPSTKDDGRLKEWDVIYVKESLL